MIELVVIYVGSIVSSLIINKLHELVMVKDLADNNYKLNTDETCNIDEERRFDKYYIFIPIYNVCKSLSDYITYKSDVFFQTKAYTDNLIKEFSPIEKEEYHHNPSLINANLLEYKMCIKRKMAHKIVIDDSLIYYNLSMNKGLEVVDSEGRLSHESRTYQTNKLYEAIEKSLDEVVKDTLDEVEDKDEYLKEIEMTKEYLKNARNYLEEQKNIKKLTKTK